MAHIMLNPLFTCSNPSQTEITWQHGCYLTARRWRPFHDGEEDFSGEKKGVKDYTPKEKRTCAHDQNFLPKIKTAGQNPIQTAKDTDKPADPWFAFWCCASRLDALSVSVLRRQTLSSRASITETSPPPPVSS